MPKVFKFTVDAVTGSDVAYIVADTREQAQKIVDDTNYADWARKQDIISYEAIVEKTPVREFTTAKIGTVFTRLKEVVE